MPERYLVTGAAGFIGSRVSELLLAAGHEVVGVDNFNHAYDVRLKEWRWQRLAGHASFAGHSLDVADAAALPGLLKSQTAPFAGLLHLAARAGVRYSVDHPTVYYQTNVLGTLHALELCRQARISKLVLASTSSLYGESSQPPYQEDAPTDRPLSPYAASKKGAEALAYAYHHLHGIDVSVLRYFTVYGPAGRPDMSVLRFIRHLAEGEPLVLYGDGTQSRDFTYIDDIARGTIAALKPLGYEVINLGSDRPAPMSRLIELLASMLGATPKIDRRPAHRADARITWASIQKAERLLGWKPQTALSEGLAQTVAWYRANRDLARSLDLGEAAER